jgi:hypothetical protein
MGRFSTVVFFQAGNEAGVGNPIVGDFNAIALQQEIQR